MTTVRAALIQANANMEKKEAIDKHVEMIADAARQGAQVVGLQEIFYGPVLLRGAGPEVVRDRRAGRRPDGDPDAGASRGSTGWCSIVPFYEEEQTGRVLQHRVRHRARRHSARQVPQDPHPAGRAVLLGEVLLQARATSGTRCSTRRVGKIGVIICYDRHFPEVARELGLKGAEIVFNPSATVASPLEVPLGARAARTRRRERLLRRARQPRRRRGAPRHRASSTARATSAARAARSSRRPRPPRTRSWSATSTSTRSERCATPGSSSATAGPRPTASSPSCCRDGRRGHVSPDELLARHREVLPRLARALLRASDRARQGQGRHGLGLGGQRVPRPVRRDRHHDLGPRGRPARRRAQGPGRPDRAHLDAVPHRADGAARRAPRRALAGRQAGEGVLRRLRAPRRSRRRC